MIAQGSACQKSLFDKLVDGGVNYPQFAMVTLLRLAACSVPLLIGLTSRCFAHWAHASCAPRHCHPLNQFPLKSYGFPGAETARKRFLLWKMGFSVAKISPDSAAQVAGVDLNARGLRPSRALLGLFDSLSPVIAQGFLAFKARLKQDSGKDMARFVLYNGNHERRKPHDDPCNGNAEMEAE